MKRLFYFIIFVILTIAPLPALAQSTDEQSVLSLVNQERALDGKNPLAWDSCLADAAQAHNEDMIANNIFSHTGSNGSSASQRAAAAGSPATSIGENIAAGYTTPASVMVDWMNSSGHRANILRSGYTHIGISRVNNHWTQVFGNAGCSGGTTGSSSTGGSSSGGSSSGSSSSNGTSTNAASSGGSSSGSSSSSGTSTNAASTNNSSSGTTSNNQTNTAPPIPVPDACSSVGGNIQVSALAGMTCTSINANGIGNQWVIDQGFINAVDIWGNFSGSVDVCIRGSGSLIFMDAAGAPRVPTPISSVLRGDMTCTTISTAGSVILVGSGTRNQATASTQVTTTVPSNTTTQSVPNNTGSIIHVVQSGENLFRIGLRYNIPYQELATLNNINTDYRIFVGQQIVIPAR